MTLAYMTCMHALIFTCYNPKHKLVAMAMQISVVMQAEISVCSAYHLHSIVPILLFINS